MNRVSTNMATLDSQYHTMMREWEMNRAQNQMQSGMRVQDLRDDPLAAAKSTRLGTSVVRMEQYSKNIDVLAGNLTVTEEKVTSALEHIQRLRELAVQGANGIYDKEQLGDMAREVDQHLEALAEIANSRDGVGNSIFAGFDAKQSPFMVMRGRVDNGVGDHIVEVLYRGDIGRNKAEVSEESLVSVNIPGNYAFWAENQNIYSSVAATGYQVQENSTIRIDGVDIDLKAGDNVYTVMQRINDSAAPVKATLDPVKDSLVLASTNPHQLWVQDLAEGTVLRDLGITKDGRGFPPNNIATSAMVSGGSIFDATITLRDSLYRGDIHGVNRALGGMETAVEGLSRTLGEIGALTNRLEITQNRISSEQAKTMEYNSNEIDVDITQAIMNSKMLEFAHEAALGVAGRILRPTLLDFLR